MTHEKFNAENLINLIITNDVDNLKLFISELASSIDGALDKISEIQRTLKALEAAGFNDCEQYKKLNETAKDLQGSYKYYLRLKNQAESALKHF